MLTNGRFSGHIVAGHVDRTVHPLIREQMDNAYLYRRGPKSNAWITLFIRGSITIDGISLTIMRQTDAGYPYLINSSYVGRNYFGSAP